MLIEVSKIRIVLNSLLEIKDATQLRGFFGNLYKNIVEFHGHKGDKFLNKHPLIQYKFFNGSFLIMGLQEGAYLLKALKKPDYIEIWHKKLEIEIWESTSETFDLGLSSELFSYSFETPWVGLNEENYEKYQKIKNQQEKIKELFQRILIGNMLSLSKAVKYTASDRIIVNSNLLESGKYEVKYDDEEKIHLKTFDGEFTTNFRIPSGWGLGKFSSRGYGIVVPSDGGQKDE